MRSLREITLAATLVMVLLVPAHHAAAATKNKGLLITPLREYVTVDAGEATSKSITVANLTEKTITVALSVEQFSVADYTYDYEFKPVKNDWIKLGLTEVELKPNKSQKVPYQIDVPDKASPGGHYFTIFATTSFSGGGIRSQVQATTVLYLTVNGTLQKTSTVHKSSAPSVSFGKDIPFTLEVQNTGNTHFFAYTSGELTGLGSKKVSAEITRLLIPDAPRKLGATIPAPLLPGVYKATYGYRTDAGQTVSYSKHILYLPVWSIAVPFGLGWIGLKFWRHRKTKA